MRHSNNRYAITSLPLPSLDVDRFTLLPLLPRSIPWLVKSQKDLSGYQTLKSRESERT